MPIASPQRSAQATTLIETLMVVIVTSIISLAMFAVLWLNTTIQNKANNSLDAANAARTAIERIGRDVRGGRSLGDVFGDLVPDGMGGQVVQGSATFPSSLDPIYGNSQAPAGGAWPAAWGSPPYTCSNTCLIVQVPVFDSNKWPTEIIVGQGNPAVLPVQGSQANVETHIYQIVADPDPVNHPNEFQLQYFCAPGFQSLGSGYVPASHTFGPEVLVTGIIGPQATGSPSTPVLGNLKVFQYLAKKGSQDDTTPTGQPQDSINSATLANFTGVIINLELKKHQASTRQPITLAFKQEVFVRNNALATSTGDLQN
jgi:type II secretory pathway pseudopilin PulG